MPDASDIDVKGEADDPRDVGVLRPLVWRLADGDERIDERVFDQPGAEVNMRDLTGLPLGVVGQRGRDGGRVVRPAPSRPFPWLRCAGVERPGITLETREPIITGAVWTAEERRAERADLLGGGHDAGAGSPTE
ncbi:MAG TPA: hypothetical protein VFA49_01030 [Chloroflexota bacterium]|nr:hypothetical protein [Chloroflexota bacterium]